MERTQATICGAPNAMAIPKIAAIHHPHETRFAIAMAPSTITRITAMGVSHARMLVCSAVAPVMNGELCAPARSGTAHNRGASTAPRTAQHEGRRAPVPIGCMTTLPLRFVHTVRRNHALRSLLTARLELLALDLSR